MFVHTSNIEVTGLNTDDKWRINKLEGKNVRAARPETEKKVVAKQEKTTTKKEEKISKSTDKTSKMKKNEMEEK